MWRTGMSLFQNIGPAGKSWLQSWQQVLMFGSSFQNTDLDYQLRQRTIENLVLGGLTANTCLESTARYAYEL
jgi:nicotinamidase-related amidase